MTAKLKDSRGEGCGDAEDADFKLKVIEVAMNQAADRPATAEGERQEEAYQGQNERLRNLIEERRKAKTAARLHEHVQISKEIQKEIKRRTRAKKRNKIEGLLAKFEDLSSLNNIKGQWKKHRIASMRNKEGKTKTGRQDIVDVFAEFYEELYSSKEVQQEGLDAMEENEEDAVERITEEEIRSQIKQLKKKKTADGSHIVAEMLQGGGDYLIELIAEVFNDILSGDSGTPKDWQATRLKVLYKRGSEAPTKLQTRQHLEDSV